MVATARPVLDRFRLDAKVAVVIGGAGRLGTHVSRALAEAGAHVVIASRDRTRCRALARGLVAGGLAATAARVDLASEASVLRLRDRLVASHGRIDILVNGATSGAGGLPETTGAADWGRALRVEATGLFLACRYIGEVMCRQRAGAIVNVGSIYGTVAPDFGLYAGGGPPSPVTYAFVKAGMGGLTRYLAARWARAGVRVNCVAYGGYRSGTQTRGFLRRYGARNPLGRMMSAEEIGGPVVFLASAAAAYVTGHTLLVDGGFTAR
jgi:NAD(P)-dependent dehydrogenase (short-subunit alcohol dehydrogenase family)